MGGVGTGSALQVYASNLHVHLSHYTACEQAMPCIAGIQMLGCGTGVKDR